MIICDMDDLDLIYQGHQGCKGETGDYMIMGFEHLIVNSYSCYITHILDRQKAIPW